MSWFMSGGLLFRGAACYGARGIRPFFREIEVERYEVMRHMEGRTRVYEKFSIVWITRRPLTDLDRAGIGPASNRRRAGDGYYQSPIGEAVEIAGNEEGLRLKYFPRRRHYCGHGRWVESHDRCVRTFSDSRMAEECARRLRYRIPQWWEWLVIGGVALAEAGRLLIGDRGLLGILGWLP